MFATLRITILKKNYGFWKAAKSMKDAFFELWKMLNCS